MMPSKLRISLLSAALILGFAAASAPARAGLFDDDEARKAIIELRGRFEALNRDLSNRINDLSLRMDRMEATQRGQLELQSQLEAMRRELADLRGKLEVQTEELARTQVQQREMASTLESRLSNIDTRVKKVEPVMVTATIDERTVNVDQEEKRRFDLALGMLRNSEFRPAATAFAQFQTQFPDSPYAASAIFWQASSLFAAKDYRGSIASNERFLNRFPTHPRAADASLSIGYAQIELGDRTGARKTLETLIEKYPGTEAAKQARDRLANLRR